jgi:hypothetical protein
MGRGQPRVFDVVGDGRLVSAIRRFDAAVPIDLTHGPTDGTQPREATSCLASRFGGNRGAVT